MGAIKEIRKTHPDKSLWRWFRETRESELLVVAGEDIAALAGLAIAFVAVLLTMVTGNPVYDALGSIGVGVLLMVIAWLVAREVKSMIVGESAGPEVRGAIEAHLRARSEIRSIINMITLQWGRHVVVAVQAEMIDYASGRAMVDAINEIEADLQAAFPQVRWVFLNRTCRGFDALSRSRCPSGPFTVYSNPVTACGTYSSSSRRISSALRFSESAATASSR